MAASTAQSWLMVAGLAVAVAYLVVALWRRGRG